MTRSWRLGVVLGSSQAATARWMLGSRHDVDDGPVGRCKALERDVSGFRGKTRGSWVSDPGVVAGDRGGSGIYIQGYCEWFVSVEGSVGSGCCHLIKVVCHVNWKDEDERKGLHIKSSACVRLQQG